jgi:putative ABC transport system permease protein
MRKMLNIVATSLRMAFSEFRSNKLRTALSLLGITFGIFCIISVVATISSMKTAIQNDIKSLGGKSIFIDKWEYRNDNDYPWWRFVKRPDPKFTEVKELKERVPVLENAAFLISTNETIEFQNDLLKSVNYYGVTEDFANMEHFDIAFGHYLLSSDFDRAANVAVIGYSIAEKIFNKPEKALGQTIRIKDQKPVTVVGVIAKQGKSTFDMWEYDNCIIMPYGVMKQVIRVQDAQPRILVAGKDNVSIPELKGELTGAMRSIHKLKPGQDDDYSLNDIDTLSHSLDDVFANVNVGGWAIAALSLVVGMFGVANIMFVTVRERTGQIGLKKAIGAKKRTIIMEFLLESTFLCIIGGLIGLVAVYILAAIFSSIFSFSVTIPGNIIALAVTICLVVGIAAGIIPAVTAAKMDPVVAIRSTT